MDEGRNPGTAINQERASRYKSMIIHTAEITLQDHPDKAELLEIAKALLTDAIIEEAMKNDIWAAEDAGHRLVASAIAKRARP